MTLVWRINCDKWKTILGIVVWSGATTLLALGIYGLVDHIAYDKSMTCLYDKSISIRNDNTVHCTNDGGVTFFFFWIMALLGNGGNAFCIFYVINKHFKLLRVECTKEANK